MLESDLRRGKDWKLVYGHRCAAVITDNSRALQKTAADTQLGAGTRFI